MALSRLARELSGGDIEFCNAMLGGMQLEPQCIATKTIG